MKLLVFLLICISRGELPLITTEMNDTTITYKGTGKIDLLLGLLSAGKQIIVVEEGITEIGDGAFSGVEAVDATMINKNFTYHAVYLPRSLKSIGNFAFALNTKLDTLLFPKYEGTNSDEEREKFYALRSIGKGALMKCSSLKNANVPSTYTVVEDYIFKGTPVTGHKFNSKTTKIGIGAFQDCTLLKSIAIPSTVTSVGESAFENCISLQNATCEAESCSFGGQCFKDCVSLKEFTFPKSAYLGVPGGIFENCASLAKCTMPTTLNTEGILESTTAKMFLNCKNLATVTLPTNIKALGESMFKNTSIETLYLPTSVNMIEPEALRDCTKLKYVNVSSPEKTTIGLNTFDNTPNLELLAVHGNLTPLTGDDVLGGKKFCYYGQTNPEGSKLALDQGVTTVYVTKSFKNNYEYFGAALNTSLDKFIGYPCQVMQGYDCSFPGEPGLPTESETMSYSDEISETEDISGTEEISQSADASLVASEMPTESSSADSGIVDNDDHKKKKKLSTGAIIGIVLGCLAFLALLLLLIICCCKKHRHNKLETKGDKKESSIALKKTSSKKGYESVDNLKDQQPEKLMV